MTIADQRATAGRRPFLFTEVGADFIGGAWVFTWADTGATISAADAPTTAADTIARAVGARP